MILWLLACDASDTIPLHFDGPVAGAVLPEGSTPFFDPVGLVANSRSGTILPLTLKEGRFLSEDPMAPFLRGSSIPTGRSRILSDLAAYTDGQSVTLWAMDNGSQKLLQIPWITAWTDSGPQEVEPTVSTPQMVDGDGSGDTASISEVKVRAGYTTTEIAPILGIDHQNLWCFRNQTGIESVA